MRRSLLQLLALLAVPAVLRAQPTVDPLAWTDSAQVLEAVLDSMAGPTRSRPVVVRLLSCAHLRAPCAAYGGWGEDSVRAVALLAARNERRSSAGFRGADSVEIVTLGAPRFRGRDSAMVFVRFQRGPGPFPGHGVVMDGHALIVRNARGWQFVQWRMSRIT